MRWPRARRVYDAEEIYRALLRAWQKHIYDIATREDRAVLERAAELLARADVTGPDNR